MVHTAVSTFVGIALLFLRVGTAAAEDFPNPLLAAYFHPDRNIPRTASADEQVAAIRQSLDRMQKSGFNAIFPYFTGSSGQAYYSSQIHADNVYGECDPLAVLIQEARLRNLQVYPVLCATVCGNDKPAGILLEKSDWALRHPDGSPLGYISPAHSEARQWLANVAREVVERYQPDGIVLDYIRYRNRPLLLDRAAEIRFKAAVPSGATSEEEQKLMQQFKEAELTELVRSYSETIRATRPGTRLGIYSWGPHVAANHQIAQCWPRWVKEGYLDFVNVSGYYHHDKYGDKYLKMFEDKMRAAVQLNQETSKPVPLSFALGVETSHGKVHTAADIRTYLRKAVEVRLDGVVFFTWHDLLPFLDELDETDDIRNFPAAE